jgi:hypothetical protein
LREQIDRTYPPGRFVAADAGRIIADAESHRALVEKLESMGRSPRNLVILEAGADYPESMTILSVTPEHDADA